MSMQGLKAGQILVFGIILLLYLVVSVIHSLPKVTKEEHTNLFPGSQSTSLKHDCDVEVVYSMNDNQCNRICKQQGQYVSKHGICVNILAFNTQEVTNQCDPEKGVLAYLIGDPQMGRTKLFCLSIDQGVQPDDVTKENTICTGGKMMEKINYIRGFPQLKSCQCERGFVLTVLANTSVVRSRGICVPEKSQKGYEFNKLLFSHDHV